MQKDQKKVHRGYGGPPKCSYSSKVGLHASNVDNHCPRVWLFDGIAKFIWIKIELLKLNYQSDKNDGE